MEKYVRYDGRKTAEPDYESTREYVYLYRLSNDGIDKVYGYIKKLRQSKGGYVQIFRELENDKCISRLAVSSEEGVVYRNNLWLKKENDELAIETFIEHKKHSLESLKNKVNECKEIIRKLNKELANCSTSI